MILFCAAVSTLTELAVASSLKAAPVFLKLRGSDDVHTLFVIPHQPMTFSPSQTQDRGKDKCLSPHEASYSQSFSHQQSQGRKAVQIFSTFTNQNYGKHDKGVNMTKCLVELRLALNEQLLPFCFCFPCIQKLWS